MKQDERDRLTRLEERFGAFQAENRSDMRDVKASIKTLEEIALGGKGALKSALFIGGCLGWLVSVAVGMWHAATFFRAR